MIQATPEDMEGDQAYCPNCVQFGLPLLLARYAVCRSDEDVARPAPPLQAPFGAGVQDIALPPAEAHYALRLLRGGYVYAFNEARGEWLAWQANDHGDLSPFDIRAATPPPQNDTAPASCSRHDRAMLSKCILLPDAKWATTLWLTYSAVPWTNNVWKRHHDHDYRRRSMRRIDVATWRASGHVQPHVASLYDALEQVAEFHLADGYAIHNRTPGISDLPLVHVTPLHTFEHSLIAPSQFAQPKVDLLRAQARLAAHQQRPGHPLAVGPMLVALDDPIGIASDLNQLAVARLLEWENEPERVEKRQSAAAITALREAIKHGALEEEKHRRLDHAMVGRAVVATMGGRGAARTMSRSLPLWHADVFAVEDEDEVLRLGRESWEKYRKHLRDGDAYERWLKETYVTEQAAFYGAHVAALDEAYVAWLSAAAFKQHMVCNFDSTCATSGVLYQETVTALLQDATSRGTVFQYVLDCLENDDPLDPGAILLRAQVWNQDALITLWKQTLAKTSTGPGARDWMVAANGLSNAFKGMLDHRDVGRLGGMFQGSARLLEQLSGPVTRMVGDEVGRMVAGNSGRLPARWQVGLLTAIAQSASPGSQLVDLTGHTTPKRARKALAMTLAARAGLNSVHQASAAASEAISSVGAHMEGGRFKFGMIALVNDDQLKLFKALNAKAVITGTARQAHLQRTLSALDLHDAMRTNVSSMHRSSHGYGLAGLVLMAASLGELNKQIQQTPAGSRGLLKANFAAGVAALVGDAAILLGEVGSKLPWLSQKLAEPMGRWMFRATTRAAVLQATGRWLSGVAGVLIGGLSVYEGYKTLRLNRAYGMAMIASGATGVIASILILSGTLIPLAILFLIFSAIIAVVSAWLKSDDVEMWLDKALYFGNNETGSFADMTCQNSAIESLRF